MKSVPNLWWHLNKVVNGKKPVYKLAQYLADKPLDVISDVYVKLTKDCKMTQEEIIKEIQKQKGQTCSGLKL